MNNVNVWLCCYGIIIVLVFVAYYYAAYKAKKLYNDQTKVYEQGIFLGDVSMKDVYQCFMEAGGLGITNAVMEDDDTLMIFRNGYEHHFYMENGAVHIEYPTEGFYIAHGMSAAIHQIKLHRKNLRIVDGNQLMDYLLSKTPGFSPQMMSHTKQYSLASKLKHLMYSSIVIVMVATLLLCYEMNADTEQKLVDNMKARTLKSTQITLGQAVDYYMPDAEWEYFTTDDEEYIVQVTGHHSEEGGDKIPYKIQLQFMNVGSEDAIDSSTKVRVVFMSVDGKACSGEEISEYMEWILESYEEEHD